MAIKVSQPSQVKKDSKGSRFFVRRTGYKSKIVVEQLLLFDLNALKMQKARRTHHG